MLNNDITKNDIQFLKKLGCDINKNNLETLLFIKNYCLPDKNNDLKKDEKNLYSMLTLEGFNNPKSKKYSQLGEKLCGTFNDSNNQKHGLNSRLLVLGYIKESNKEIILSNEEKIKKLETIKKKLMSQQKSFIKLIQNENISNEYKKALIERALKYNLAEPQKQSVINMAYEKSPTYIIQNTNTRTKGRVR